jgi:hypothetical protein
MGLETSTYSGGAPGEDVPVSLHKEAQEARSSERNISAPYRNFKKSPQSKTSFP